MTEDAEASADDSSPRGFAFHAPGLLSLSLFALRRGDAPWDY